MDARKLVDKFGSVAKLAQAIGVTRQTVYNWLELGIPERTVPWIKAQLQKQIDEDFAA